MNRLVIIGNGFDIAHGLKTSYMDFINWYWDQRVDSFVENYTYVSKDRLCEMVIRERREINSWNYFAYQYLRRDFNGQMINSVSEIIQFIKDNNVTYDFKCSPFFSAIQQSIESKGWVDIENDYYQTLKKFIANSQYKQNVSDLNEQLEFLQDNLTKYLGTMDKGQGISNLHNAMIDYFNPADFSTMGKWKALDSIGVADSDVDEIYNDESKRDVFVPKQIMLLSFNYTNTARIYQNFNITHNYIHGELDNPKNIIFGYGDELDKDYHEILDRNDNILLKNVKSVKYLETRHYRDLLEFIQSAPFQVFIMGHSCGNSDRTLLNTVFEHENCVSIKPFYHKWDDERDNYLELVQNISRNFTDMKLFRDRVVNKELCLTM